MRKVLLIEDSVDDRELVKRAIRKSGHEIEVTVAEDGKQALETLGLAQEKRINQIKPHLIMLDLKIPILSGKEVLKEIKQNDYTQSIPVVIFTSSREDSDLRECNKLGANSFIRKPVNADEFNQTIEMILNYWFELDQL